MYMYVYIYIYIDMYIERYVNTCASPGRATKEGQWVLRAPPAYLNPFFSPLGMVLRTLVSF